MSLTISWTVQRFYIRNIRATVVTKEQLEIVRSSLSTCNVATKCSMGKRNDVSTRSTMTCRNLATCQFLFARNISVSVVTIMCFLRQAMAILHIRVSPRRSRRNKNPDRPLLAHPSISIIRRRQTHMWTLSRPAIPSNTFL